MKINRITVVNFGSYENENCFDTKGSNDRNIVLIGGKNGAGKTTLFTAMRVCLYGFLSMGYKNANSYYTRAITKLINNNAKKSKPCSSSVSLDIELNNGRGLDCYTIARKWLLRDSLSEEFSVIKNGLLLNKEETAVFEKYLLSIIPPELFNLYFFDGERIADFFLNEGSDSRIKNAFLTLCGYDTFEIMRKNFKRISSLNKGANRTSLNEYIEAREQAKGEKEKFEQIHNELFNCATEIENCDADIVALENDFVNGGGITQEEWGDRILSLKEEEKKREAWNAMLKKWANDVIPFIMVSSTLKRIKDQIKLENDDSKYQSFIDILDCPEIADIVGEKREEIAKIVSAKYDSGRDRILDLSFEQSANLMSIVTELLGFDRSRITKVKNRIKQSISKSSRIRRELELSSVSTAQEYMRTRATLFEKKSCLLDKRLELEQRLQQQKETLAIATSSFSKALTALEEDIKRESISDISARAIVMLDKLQSDLYKRQIEKVELEFRRIINLLMRKTRFIDDIRIDEDFGIHIFRNEEIDVVSLSEIVATNSEEQFVAIFGERALHTIRSLYGEVSFGMPKGVVNATERIMLPIEIDKESLSNGEKQIFIMALYYALIRLGKHEVPFVIDTPFARIDTEHRLNIARYFFSELEGQVFILSTNEEITGEYVQILRDKVLVQYLLENSDNKKTMVVKDTYFEV